jgi:hypothetical protein
MLAPARSLPAFRPLMLRIKFDTFLHPTGDREGCTGQLRVAAAAAAASQVRRMGLGGKRRPIDDLEPRPRERFLAHPGKPLPPHGLAGRSRREDLRPQAGI